MSFREGERILWAYTSCGPKTRKLHVVQVIKVTPKEYVIQLEEDPSVIKRLKKTTNRLRRFK